MRKVKFRLFFWGAMAGILIIGSTGCTKAVSTSSNSANSYTYVSMMNLAPYSPSTVLYLNGAAATSAIAAGSVSQNYGSITPGNYAVNFETSTDSVLAQLASAAYDSASFYSLVLYNTPVTHTSQAVRITDDFSGISSSNSNFRFFHMSPDLGAVDLYLNGTLTQAARTSADIVSSSALTAFQQVTANTYSIQVMKSGTDTVIATIRKSLTPGNAYTIFLSGSSNVSSDTVTLNILEASY